MIDINKIYNEDCLETLKKIPDNFIDLVITSPPYNMRTRIRNGQYTTREKSEHFSKKYKFFDDALPINEFYEFHKKVISELLRTSKIICYNFQIVTGSKEAFFRIIGDFNKDIKDIIIWDKGHGQPAMHERILNSCYEFILILEGDKKCGRMIQNAVFKRGEMNNILRISRNKQKDKSHNAVFPFMGSGTTAIVAISNNRKYIGSEIIKEYFEMAEYKISKTRNGNE